VDDEGQAVSTVEAPPSEEPAPRQGRISFKLVGQAGAVVGLIGGIVGLVFTFAPSLRPGSGSATKPAAELDVGTVSRRVPLGEYLAAERIPRGTFSAEALRHLGAMVTIGYDATGFGGKDLQLDVSLTNADTGATACAHRYAIPAGGGPGQTMRAWMAFPGGAAAARGTYNLHVSLFGPEGKPPPLRAKDHDGIPGPVTDAGPAGAVAALC